MDKKESDLAYHKAILVTNQRILHEVDAVIKSTERAIEELEAKEETEHRFYVGQPVKVIVGDERLTRYGIYVGVQGDGLHLVNLHSEIGTRCFVECEPNFDAASSINWIEWIGGEKEHGEYVPNFDDSITLALFKDGSVKMLLSGVSWRHDGITAYAIIKQPEWCE